MISFAAEQRFIVTGASSGIGRGVALLLNELGATVIGIGRNEERLQAMKEKVRFPENVFLEQKDLVEDIAGLPSYVKQLREKYGKFQYSNFRSSAVSFPQTPALQEPMRSLPFQRDPVTLQIFILVRLVLGALVYAARVQDRPAGFATP